MLDITQWSKEFIPGSKPWLILGKGPSFRKTSGVDLSGYHTCALNHVVRQLPVTLAHLIDIDVVADCAADFDKNARFLAMPFRPHFKNSPSDKTLPDFIRELPVLQKMARENRLVWYNLSTSSPHGDSPVINAKFFSAEAALNLLVACGAKVIRSLGVDGGQTYSHHFDDLKGKTLLANGHQNFDRQFKGICETIRKSGVLYAPLHVKAPIRVFVGTDAAQMMGVKMLEYSIKKQTPMSVEIVPINDNGLPVPRHPANKTRSGFSFCRFNIPRLCSYKGRAIYMDADMQVFTDLTSLWTWPMEGADIVYCDQPEARGRVPQFSVMVMNCSNLPWNVQEVIAGLDDGKYTYQELMNRFCIVPENRKNMALPFEWNSLEFYDQRTCLIHYTDMNTQPWVTNQNPNGYLWYALLREAVQEGFVALEDLYAEIRKGHVSPQLPDWAGLPAPKDAAELLKNWVPPYKRFETGIRV